jgi:hypothetical protein
MQIERLRSLIRESIQEHIKEIETVAEAAAMEARLAEYDKAIKMCEDKIAAAENLEEIRDLVDDGKINELKKKLKTLTKTKEKLEKQKAKKNKGGKEVTTDAETDKEENVGEVADAMDETYVDETYTMDEMEKDSMKEEALNESFLKMQKLAGVITETQYNQKKKALVENQVNEFDMDQFSLGSAPKASFEDKWNAVPNANKEVLKKSTGKEPILIMASSKGSNYLVAKGSDDKFYLYIFTQAANPGEPKGPFNSEEDAKKGVK